ncbi:N amino acid transport system protein [Tolypocladium paradoxum]|uniref:N amino acid transport system protein n=1 Tax=Tolypocladium paradoxum TaxID=94208 RepID=A0A2S4LA57_9HYPO|nr:N amino acid transport system protein [Tolypocladium paradoxum]
MGDPVFSAWPAPGASFVSIMVAFLNICYTFIGQITLPSFIAEMTDPRDFPKALWSCTIAELVVFCTIGITIYKFTGIQYMTSPAFGGLENMYKILSFSFMLPTIVILGAVYASITGRFVFIRLFSDSKHMYSHTVTGWLSWGGILIIIWVLGFVVSQVIPFFSSLLALVAAVFDAFFGFIYWGVAWFRMRSADRREGRRVRSKEWDMVLVLFNVFLVFLGTILFLVVGTIASIQHIMEQFAVGAVKGIGLLNTRLLMSALDEPPPSCRWVGPGVGAATGRRGLAPPEVRTPRTVARLQAHVNAIGASPDGVSSKTCDLSQPDTIEHNVLQLLEFATEGGKLDHVVFTAGDAISAIALEDVTVEIIHKTGMVRQVGSITLAKYLPRYMNVSVRSSTVTGGTNTWRPGPNWAIIAGSGGAIEGLSRGFAVGLAPVRVNCVQLGDVHEERQPAVLESLRREGITGPRPTFASAPRRAESRLLTPES